MGIIKNLKEEVRIIRERDPAIHSSMEVLLYPSFKVMIHYRLAHKLYVSGHYFWARYISQRGVRKTGIEIHPGAQIGKGFFIDHGNGVIIGETTIIGDNVTLYQGVTLGGTGKEHGKRHPTIGNNVIIGSGAQVLGPIKIGNNAKIGSNAIVVKEVPANTTVIGMAAHKVQELSRKEAQKFCAYGIDASHPDPMEERFEKLCRELENVKKELAELKKEKKNDAK